MSLKKIQKEKTFKVATLNGVIGIIVLGIFSITDSSIEVAISKGIVGGIVIFLSILLWGKISWEKRVKKLQSKKYEGLNELGIVFNDNLYYEGVYHGFIIRIVPSVKKEKNDRIVEYDVIQAYYQSKSRDTDEGGEAEKIDYHLGELYFFDKYVCFIPKDYIKPNYKDNLDGLVNILVREEYKPISRDD